MKLSARLAAERRYVEESLGNSIICGRCGATLATYADDCKAELSNPCPGFMVIENARHEFNKAA